MIRLFLYDKFENATKEYEVELKEDIQISITKQFTDLENPTAIKNDWSKTVAIPFTQKNNEIFGCLFRADRTVTANAPVGQFDFDASKKVQFRLFNDSNLIMTGYMKVLSVEQKTSVVGSYNVTLNGELGRVFQEISEITFAEDMSTDDHYINGRLYVDEFMTKELISKCWQSRSQSTLNIIHKDQTGYKVTDYIGFAPSNAFSESFDYTSVELSSGLTSETKKIAEWLQEKWDTDGYTEYKADSVVKNGILPIGMREFRSYLQIPYIYFNKLFGIFKEKAEELTGYNIILDPNWFAEGNPYWSSIVFCLKGLNLKPSKQNKFIKYIMNTKQITLSSPYYYSRQTIKSTDQQPTTGSIWDNTYEGFRLNTNYDYIDEPTIDITIEVEGENPSLDIDIDSLLLITLYQQNIHHQNSRIDRYYIANSTYIQQPSLPGTVIIDKTVSAKNGKTYMTFKLPLIRPLYREFYGDFVEFIIEYNTVYQNRSLFNDSTIESFKISSSSVWKIGLPTSKRSFNNFTLNDLWDNDYKLFDVILNYCKMYRIYISIDEVNKNIIFMSTTHFFSNYTVEDWSDKVDYSKPWKLEPTILDSKYLLFNYDNSESEILKKYKEQFESTYGSVKVNTDYQFDTNSKNMFNGIKTSNVTLLSSLDIDHLYYYHDTTYKKNNTMYIDNMGDNNKEISMFGQYYFFAGVHTFDNDVKITDDTENQVINNTFCYNQVNNDYLQAKTCPSLQLIMYGYGILFGAPAIAYYDDNFSGVLFIYDNFWKNYLNEIYALETKKVTCYVRLDISDYTKFDFNKFVTIQNQLFFVNKISDYTLNTTEATKVELISVKNLESYKGTPLIWSIWPKTQQITGTEFVSTTFKYFIYDNSGINISNYNIQFAYTNIPSTWTKTITTNKINDSTIEIDVRIQSPFVVQSASEYYFEIEVLRLAIDQVIISGTIQVIRDTDMAHEMTP